VLSAREVAGLLARQNPGLKRDEPPRGLALLDLREAGDFVIGHLPGARNFPFRPDSAGLETSIRQGWPGADPTTLPLVLYCYGVECVRSRKAGAMAARSGFRHVLWFRGGIREWRKAGYPLPESPRRRAPTRGG
jgi:rhodanese-related sulfurtransferase